MAEVQTNFGTVRIIGKNEPIPEGWRVLTIGEGRQIKE